jgi:sugar lactone lactonase YvrE
MLPQIHAISPTAGIPGGEIIITGSQFDSANFRQAKVLFGSTAGRIISASPKRIIVAIPEITGSSPRPDGVRLATATTESESFPFTVGERLADTLHPVANPVVDPETGNIFTTLSGTRGQKVPVSVWKISPRGESSPFLSSIVNPTGLAINDDGTLYISSRQEGTVYRVSVFKELDTFAEDLGVATGLAFDRAGYLYVGDRQGTIYKVDKNGQIETFAHLEPSVAAYHLAFGPDDRLYVTGPTAASSESIMAINADGDVSTYYTGLGRPQGLTFDKSGNLYVAASLQGRRGIVKLDNEKNATMFMAGQSIVGIAVDFVGNMIVATNREIYRVNVGIRPLPR